MGGIFGVASESSCVLDLFFGVDYHSHLGTKRGGMAVYGEKGFDRVIHNIENSPFRTKFENDVETMEGYFGIGCISDSEPQPLLVRSHLGNYAITTVGRINNMDELIKESFGGGTTHFLEMSGGDVNPTELVASLMNKKSTLEDGIKYVQERIEGSITILVMSSSGIYAARDLKGRTPLVIGTKEGANCVSFESFAYFNLGYTTLRELGPGEVVHITPREVVTLVQPREDMKICAFLWVYYGYPPSTYEGVSVEDMRYKCGNMLAGRDIESSDNISPDLIAGVPDSGTAHAIGYSTRSGIPLGRPFVKYTPTWPRSFMPQKQVQRSLIAKMKLIPVYSLIHDKKLLLIDDSIVRGTQLRETTEFLYASGAKEVHIRTACPPLMFSCKYLNFSRSTTAMELITRRIISEIEGRELDESKLQIYTNPESEEYQNMVNKIKEHLNFTSLRYNRLDDMLDTIDVDSCKICTYCWSGRE